MHHSSILGLTNYHYLTLEPGLRRRYEKGLVEFVICPDVVECVIKFDFEKMVSAFIGEAAAAAGVSGVGVWYDFMK